MPYPQQPLFAKTIITSGNSTIHTTLPTHVHRHPLLSVPQSTCLQVPHMLGLTLISGHLDSSHDSTSPPSTTLEPLTPPELSLDYYESPPTPPQCLKDQIHEAYALDNIHLAKILYLKLQGIHVVDDSDPRIEQVREEDFPFGSLVLDEEDERSLKEYQTIERHRKRDQLRATKLAQCERTWDQSTVEYRQQCVLVQQRRQAAALALAGQSRVDSEEQERLEQHFTPALTSGLGARSLLSSKSPYDILHTSFGGSYTLEYSVPTNLSSPLDIPRSLKSSRLHREPLFHSPSQSVPFRHVSACMNGSLFQDDMPSDLLSRKRQLSHATLLEVLLQPVTWERGERSEARLRRGSSFPSFSTWSSNGTLCSACSPTSGSPSTIVSSHSGNQPFGVRQPIMPPNTNTSVQPSRIRPIVCGAHPLTPIDLQDCPLSFPCSCPQPTTPSLVQQPKSRSHFAARLVRKIGTSVSTFVDVATQFQAAYMRTTGFIVQLEPDLPHDETVAQSWGSRRARAAAKTSLPFDPTHPRAKINEIIAFKEGSAWSEPKEEIGIEQEHYTLVQLISPSERSLPPPPTSPLSMFITPSPLRPREVSVGPRYRIRPIANPVLLRLKALQNVCADGGLKWEGRAREGTLGFGRDRLHGIALDGIGRSRLSLEVSF